MSYHDVVERRNITLTRSVNLQQGNGPVKFVQSSDRVLGDDNGLGYAIRRLNDRSAVRMIDRDSRHLRGFSTWVR